jgi:hypothetical protein
MGLVVSVGSVDRVSVAAVLMGSFTTIGSAALLMGSVTTMGSATLLMGSVDFSFDSVSRLITYPVPPLFFLSFAASLPVKPISFNGGSSVYNNMKNHETGTSKG